MSYPLLLTLHLFAALIFIGTVFFEVLFMAPVHRRLSDEARKALSQHLAPRVRAVMPWVLAVLFSAGAGMAWRYREALAHPADSAFGTLLLLKITLATSVLVQVIVAMTLMRRKRLSGVVRDRIHKSVFCHMVGIVVLAKALFYFSW